jgi:predicted enzyme related to lactoylglutathione lyase
MTHLNGKFVWFELVSRDAKKAQAFYGEVFGWKVESYPMGTFTYEMIKAGDGTVGGYATLTEGKPHWLAHVSVADVDQAAKAAVAGGGKAIAPAQDIPNVGRMQRIADPFGAELSLYRSASGDAADAPAKDGEFYWNELHTTEPAKSLAFYEKVVGYTHEDMTMGPSTYHVINAAGAARGGIMASNMGEPTSWLPYVQVADTDATLARAKRNGATELVPTTDIPGIGRFAVIADPVGAAIAFIKPAPKS